jgi:hypothetical protein
MTAHQAATIDRYLDGRPGGKVNGLDINHLAATVDATWQEVRDYVQARLRRKQRRRIRRKR